MPARGHSLEGESRAGVRRGPVPSLAPLCPLAQALPCHPDVLCGALCRDPLPQGHHMRQRALLVHGQVHPREAEVSAPCRLRTQLCCGKAGTVGGPRAQRSHGPRFTQPGGTFHAPSPQSLTSWPSRRCPPCSPCPKPVQCLVNPCDTNKDICPAGTRCEADVRGRAGGQPPCCLARRRHARPAHCLPVLPLQLDLQRLLWLMPLCRLHLNPRAVLPRRVRLPLRGRWQVRLADALLRRPLPQQRLQALADVRVQLLQRVQLHMRGQARPALRRSGTA